MLVSVDLRWLCKATQGSLIDRTRLLIRCRCRLLIRRCCRLLVGRYSGLLISRLNRLLIGRLHGLLINLLSRLLIGWLCRLLVSGLNRLLINRLGRLLIGRLRGLLIDGLSRLLLIRLIVWLGSRLLAINRLLAVCGLLLISGLLSVDGLLAISRLLAIDRLLLLGRASAEQSPGCAKRRDARSDVTAATGQWCRLTNHASIVDPIIKELRFLSCRKVVREHLGPRNLAFNSRIKGARLHVCLSLPQKVSQKIVGRS